MHRRHEATLIFIRRSRGPAARLWGKPVHRNTAAACKVPSRRGRRIPRRRIGDGRLIMGFARQTIELNGCKLSLARGGKGVPLIYLHGTDGLAEWPALLDTLAQRFDVIVPDHPGFGGSEAPAWIDDISDLAYCY